MGDILCFSRDFVVFMFSLVDLTLNLKALAKLADELLAFWDFPQV